MKIETTRAALLKPLQLVTGVVERRQTLPILQNVLVTAEAGGELTLRGTDMEVEMAATVGGAKVEPPGATTISARKMLDIWRALPDGAEVSLAVEKGRAVVRSGRSRFTLSTQPAGDYPAAAEDAPVAEFDIERGELLRLLRQVGFAMAKQDVRFYLNAMLLEVSAEHIRTVATDGFRLAMCTLDKGVADAELVRGVVPRKGVLELARMLGDSDEAVHVSMGKDYLRARQGAHLFGTRLLDATYPDYGNVIPEMPGKRLVADRDALRDVLGRVAIMSHAEHAGVRLRMEADSLIVQADNPQNEEAEEELAVEYGGTPVEIGFNVAYLQDILGALDTEKACIAVSDTESSARLAGAGAADCDYVLMPLNL